jgi:hypothetical protein
MAVAMLFCLPNAGYAFLWPGMALATHDLLTGLWFGARGGAYLLATVAIVRAFKIASQPPSAA